MLQAKGLETTRRDLTSQLIGCLRKSTASAGDLSDSETATLTELFGLVAASEASELTAVQTRLRGLHREIERRRRRNARLIEESLRCTAEAPQETTKRAASRTVAAPRGKTTARSRSASARRS